MGGGATDGGDIDTCRDTENTVALSVDTGGNRRKKNNRSDAFKVPKSLFAGMFWCNSINHNDYVTCDEIEAFVKERNKQIICHFEGKQTSIKKILEKLTPPSSAFHHHVLSRLTQVLF